jgi:hypothetical protein
MVHIGRSHHRKAARPAKTNGAGAQIGPKPAWMALLAKP